MTDSPLYFRQLLSGRDFAANDPLADQMVNFVYAIGDRRSGVCVLVDPAYSVDELVDAVEADGMSVTGALATHYHPDHVGGSMMGHTIEGIDRLLGRVDVPVHCNNEEIEWILKSTTVDDTHLVGHDSGDVLAVGDSDITMMHTPGHTPGSQCFLVDGRLVAGDTLFLEGCGRTDLPGADPAKMSESLARLAKVPDDTILFPGHRYSFASSATMEAVKEMNFVYGGG